jgi:hypothetical protein
MKSNASYKPEGFHSVNPYVIVQDAAKLLDFLKQAFDAEELGRYLDASGRIAHACVKIGDSMVEMADATEQWPPMPGSFHFYVPDVDAVLPAIPRRQALRRTFGRGERRMRQRLVHRDADGEVVVKRGQPAFGEKAWPALT